MHQSTEHFLVEAAGLALELQLELPLEHLLVEASAVLTVEAAMLVEAAAVGQRPCVAVGRPRHSL